MTTTGMVNLRWFSDTNKWIDFVVSTPEVFKDEATTAVHDAMDAYWDDEFECYGDAVKCFMRDAAIPYVGIYHDADDESDEYEKKWEALLSEIGYEVIC